eukprot:GHVR01177079.1.p1 GENE.GHVR01177079.1~~GHVR01177079.1.p1  ORF type:complete len:345 (-),score=77.57 GHVR01177079.1:72-1106(-)
MRLLLLLLLLLVVDVLVTVSGVYVTPPTYFKLIDNMKNIKNSMSLIVQEAYSDKNKEYLKGPQRVMTVVPYKQDTEEVDSVFAFLNKSLMQCENIKKNSFSQINNPEINLNSQIYYKFLYLSTYYIPDISHSNSYICNIDINKKIIKRIDNNDDIKNNKISKYMCYIDDKPVYLRLSDAVKPTHIFIIKKKKKEKKEIITYNFVNNFKRHMYQLLGVLLALNENELIYDKLTSDDIFIDGSPSGDGNIIVSGIYKLNVATTLNEIEAPAKLQQDNFVKVVVGIFKDFITKQNKKYDYILKSLDHLLQTFENKQTELNIQKQDVFEYLHDKFFYDPTQKEIKKIK